MVEGDFLGLGLADVVGGGIVVVDEDGLGVLVPGDLRSQQLAQGGQRQVGGSVVDQGGDPDSGGVPDGVGGTVDLQGHVGAEGGGHSLGLAGGGGPQDQAAGESQSGGDIRFLHSKFLAFLVCCFALLTMKCTRRGFYCTS